MTYTERLRRLREGETTESTDSGYGLSGSGYGTYSQSLRSLMSGQTTPRQITVPYTVPASVRKKEDTAADSLSAARSAARTTPAVSTAQTTPAAQTMRTAAPASKATVPAQDWRPSYQRSTQTPAAQTMRTAAPASKATVPAQDWRPSYQRAITPAAPSANAGTSNFSAARLGQGVAHKGLARAYYGLGSSGAFLQDLGAAALDTVVPGFGGGADGSRSYADMLRESSAKNRAYYASRQQELEERYRPNVEAGGRVAQVIDKYGVETVRAIPQAIGAVVSAVATAGGSVAASAADLAANAAAHLSPSAGAAIAGTIKTAAGSLAKNPQYWMSFFDVLGSSYDTAVQDMTDKNGNLSDRDQTKAMLYALGNSLLNAAVEIGGGGIQELPETVRKGGQSALRAWIDSMVDEGKEEVAQGILERALQRLVYRKDNPLASVQNENAVLNPRTAAEEFMGGAVVGGVLGGGEIAVNAGLNALANRNAGQDIRRDTGKDTRRDTGKAETSGKLRGNNGITTDAAESDTIRRGEDSGGIPTFEEYRKARGSETDPEKIAGFRELMDSLSRLDLDRDGKPLVSYHDALETLVSQFPDASGAEIRQLYQQYRDDTRTILFNGQRITRAEFTDLLRTADPSLTEKQAEDIFTRVMLDTLDGSDAFTRYQAGTDESGNRSEVAAPERNEQDPDDDLPFYFGEPLPGEQTGVQTETAKQSAVENPVERVEAETDTRPGLVRDVWTDENLSRRTAAELDDTARILGRTVRFAESIREGTAQGQYQNGEIQIAQDAEDPVLFVYGHEIGHTMEELAPEEYRRFVDAVAPEIEDAAEVIRERYQEQGVERTREEALGEAANNYIGSLVNDTDTLRRFIDRHMEQKTMLEKLRDAFRRLWNKLRGLRSENVRKLQTASDLLDAALDAAAKNVRENRGTAQNETAATQDGGTSYSLKENPYKGRSMTGDAEIYSYDFLKSLPDMTVTQLPEVDDVQSNGKVNTAAVISKGMENARTVGEERDGKVFVRNRYTGKQLLVTNASIRHGLNGGLNRLLTNSRLGAVIGSVVQNAVPVNALENKKPYVSGTYAMASYASDAQGREFVAVVTVEEYNDNVSGMEVYDVTHAVSGRQNRKDNRSERADTKSQGFYPSTNASEMSIADFLSVVKSTHQSILSDDVLSHLGDTRNPGGYYTGKAIFSLKGTGMEAMDTADIRKTSREQESYITQRLADLERRAEYWKSQTKPRVPYTLRQDDLLRTARKTAKDYSSTLDVSRLVSAYKTVGEHLLKAGDGAEVLNMDLVRDTLTPVAEEMLNNAWAKAEGTDEDADAWADIKSRLKKTRLTISAQDASGIADYADFRRRNMGRLNIGIDRADSLPVDTFYQELSSLYPQYFPDTILNPTDQLLRLSEAWDDMQPLFENPHARYLSPEYTDFVVNDMLDRLMNNVRETAPTFADRAEARRQRDVNAEREKRERQRQRDRERMEEIRQEGIRRTEKAVAMERERTRKAKQRYKDYVDRRRTEYNRKNEKSVRDRLTKAMERLEKLRTTRDTSAIIRETLENLNEVCQLVTREDFLSRADSTKESLRSVLTEIYERQKEQGGDTYTTDEAVWDRIKALRHNVDEMDIRDCKILTEVLRALEHEARTHRQLITGEGPGGAPFRQSVFLAGESLIRDIRASKGIQRNSRFQDVAAWLDDAVVTQVLDPRRAMRRWTGYNDDSTGNLLFQDLARGQRTAMDYQMRAWNGFRSLLRNKNFVRRFSGKHADEITVKGWGPDGETEVKITPAMRTELCLHKLNGEHNLRHLKEGGATVPDLRLYKAGKVEQAFNQGTTVRFSETQLDNIIADMTGEERTFARLCFRYFNDMAPSEVNQVFEALKGYAVYQDPNHFPLIVNRKYLNAAEFDSIKFDGTMEGRGEFKERQAGAKNPILLMGADAVVSRSISRDGQFVGLAIPVRNINKVWGVTAASFDEKGDRNGVLSSVQDALAHQWGQAALTYVEDLMADVQGTRRRKSSAWSKIAGLSARASLTWNQAVALAQFASYPSAGAVLGHQALIRGWMNPDNIRPDRDLIARFTPLLWYRSIGYGETELGDLIGARDTLSQAVRDQKGLNWIQGMDLFTTEKLWVASEYYVRAHLTECGITRADVERADGTNPQDRYYQAVANLYNRAIEETQPNYTTMQRGAVLRSDNELLRSLVMFKTQPFQNMNVLFDAVANFQAKHAKNSGFSKEQKQKAGRDLYRAVTAQIAADALFVAIKAVAGDLFRGREDKFRDENGDITPLSVASALGRDFIGTQAGKVPGGTELWDLLRASAFGDRYYGIDAANVSFVSDIASRAVSLASFVRKGLETDEDGKVRGFDPELTRLEAGRLFLTASRAFGVPAENFLNLFTGTARAAVRVYSATTGAGPVGEYHVLQFCDNPVTSGGYSLLYQALAKGNFDAFETMAKDLQEHYRTTGGQKITGKTIRDKMLSMYRAETDRKGGTKLPRNALDYIGVVDSYEADEDEAQFSEKDLNPIQYRRFREDYADQYRAIADALDRSDAWTQMDDTQRTKAKDSAAKLAKNFALARSSDGQFSVETKWMLWAVGGEKAGVTPDMAILFKTIVDTTAAVSGSKKRKAVAAAKLWMPNLTHTQINYMKGNWWNG